MTLAMLLWVINCRFIIILIFFALGIVKIPKDKNIELISKVGMARGPVLHRQKQRSRVLRPN